MHLTLNILEAALQAPGLTVCRIKRKPHEGKKSWLSFLIHSL